MRQTLLNQNEYKVNKYKNNLINNLVNDYKYYLKTFEISPIGFYNPFNLTLTEMKWTDHFHNSLLNCVLSSSYMIYLYCNRNSA